MACWGQRRGWGVPLFLAVGQMHMGSHVTRGLTGGVNSKMSVVCVCVYHSISHDEKCNITIYLKW